MMYQFITILLLSAGLSNALGAEHDTDSYEDDTEYIDALLQSIDSSLSESGALDVPEEHQDDPLTSNPSIFDQSQPPPEESLEEELEADEIDMPLDQEEENEEEERILENKPTVSTTPLLDVTYKDLLDIWPIVLINEPIHLGDTVIKKMQQQDPQGERLELFFEVDKEALGLPLLVKVAISDMVSKKDKRFKKGAYQNKLLVNGNEVGLLNHYIISPESPEIQNIAVPINPAIVQAGENTMVVEAGNFSGNLDDFVVHHLAVDLDLEEE